MPTEPKPSILELLPSSQRAKLNLFLSVSTRETGPEHDALQTLYQSIVLKAAVQGRLS